MLIRLGCEMRVGWIACEECCGRCETGATGGRSTGRHGRDWGRGARETYILCNVRHTKFDFTGEKMSLEKSRLNSQSFK